AARMEAPIQASPSGTLAASLHAESTRRPAMDEVLVRGVLYSQLLRAVLVLNRAWPHRIAMGAIAEPVAPLIFSGCTMKANSSARAAASASSSRFSRR